jgi:hypothetical protein
LAKRRWVRIVLSALLLLLAAAALVIWTQRDLPRRVVERRLAEGFGARVLLSRLEVLGRDRFLLHGVEIRQMGALPVLDRLRAERIEVHSSLGGVLAGRYSEVRLSGLEVVLAPSAREPDAWKAASDVFVERLEVGDGRLIVDAGGRRAEFDLQARLSEVGSSLGGEVRLTSSGFAVAPLVELLVDPGAFEPRARVEDLDALLRIAEGGSRITFDARSGSSSIDAGERRIELPGIALDASVLWEGRDAIRLEARPVLPDVRSAELSAVLDRDGKLREGRAELLGADLATLSALLLPLPAGAELVGSVDAELQAAGSDRLSYTIRAAVDRLEFPDAAGLRADSVRLTAEGSVDLAPGDGAGRSTSFELRAGAATTRVRGARAELIVSDAELKASGETELPSLDTAFRTDVEIARLAGRVGDWDLPAALPRLRLGGSGDASAEGVAGSYGIDGGELGRLGVDGALSFDGAAGEGALDWNWSGARLNQLADFARDAGLGLPGWIELGGAIDAQGTVRGRLDAPSLRGVVSIASLRTAPTPPSDWSLDDGTLRLRLDWPHPSEPIELPAIELRGALTVPPLDAVPIALDATASADPAGATVLVARSTLELHELGRARISARWDRALEASVELDAVELDRWRPFLKPLTGELLPGFDIRGSTAANLGVRWERESGWSGGGSASVKGSGLAHVDGSKVVEGADTDWEVSLSGSPGRSWFVDATTSVDGFLLLWGRVFGDYSERRARLDLRLETASPALDSGWVAKARLALDQGAEMNTSLRSDPARPLEYEAEIALPNLEGIFESWVHAPLADSLTALERMRAGGSLSASLGGTLSSGSRTLRGRVQVSDGRLEGTQGSVFIHGLQLDLPIDLGWQASDAGGLALTEGASQLGRLEFERVGFGDVEFEQTSTNLFVRADTVGLEEGLAVPFLGGVLGFEELTLVDGLRPGWQLESGLLLSQVRLDALSEALGIVPLEGLAEGYFPRVRLTRDLLEVDGDGEFSVFGGTLLVRDISGEDILSRFPKLTFSAELGEIDLLQVTHTFDFGEMNGTLEGDLVDCELFRWVPVRCGARFETVRRKGVPRTINVKAVSNIAILGTGGGNVGVLDRGIHKFLDRYTYEKLGVTMALKNDAFVLRGLEQRGKRELFLKGRLPFRIDVVNVQPGRAIAFRAMLDRVQRLGFSGITTTRPK